MAPSVPEEVDVFTIPHSRMKGLVSDYYDKMKSTNFSNDVDLDTLLHSLLKTFMEFKTHEQIENRFIMKKLKNKLKRLSIQNTAVCNCHKDDQLGQMMRLIKDGYNKKTEQDRWNYGLRLKQELEDFTQTFLPHMQEEEEVFQPLLLKYFTYEELCRLKQKVIQQHVIQEQVRAAGLVEKQVTDDLKLFSSSSDEDVLEKVASSAEEEEEQTRSPTIEVLPAELLHKVFCYLTPRDLCRAAQVCHRWNEGAYDSRFWRNVLPVQWAQGDWSFQDNSVPDDDEVDAGFEEEEAVGYMVIDDDADVDESEVAADDFYSDNNVIAQIQREGRILCGLARYVLPRVGAGVHRLSLRNSRAVTNGMMNKMLRQCPEVEYLDLTQTRVGDAGLTCLGRHGVGHKLKTVIFSGCLGISDATVVRLSLAINAANKHANNDHCQRNQSEGCCKGNQVTGGCRGNQSQSCRQRDQQAQDDVQRNRPIGYDKNHRPEEQCLCEEYYKTYNVVLDKRCHVQESWNNRKCGDYRRNSQVDEEKDGQSEKSLMAKEATKGDTCETTSTAMTSKDSIDAIEGAAAAIEICDNNEECDIPTTAECGGGKSSVIETEPCQRSAGQGHVSDRCSGSVEKGSVQDKNECHVGCGSLKSWGSIEDCAGVSSRVVKEDKEPSPSLRHNDTLEYLDFSGCYQVTDMGLSALSSSSLSFRRLLHLDVSGCVRMTGTGLEKLVSRCPTLAPADLYYCDNVCDGPFPDAASGCQNVCDGKRVCCRTWVMG